ncbi:helix-turn-helix transcriptional regulator [Afifella marina]|uniref:AraC-type DNA-binding protein n=1 Tax=Afifella marina DSM 2698 TaxID=1120955 RepID=A0A1G5NV87_AFIMA|nr:AraC family transcriptional regulator [Afifella marina]SCZ40651.1 AraC-type DNA-binding protein [Afifella marina DSM 2698]
MDGLTAQEFDRFARDGRRAFRLHTPNVRGSDVVVRGEFMNMELRRGLHVHHSDVVNLRDLDTEVELPAHFSIKLLLRGSTFAAVGRHVLPMPEGDGGTQPVAIALAQTEPATFRRQGRQGQRLHRLNIAITPEWFESSDFFAHCNAREVAHFCNRHLALAAWTPGRSILSRAEEIADSKGLQPWLRRLHIESSVLGIIAATFDFLTGRSGEDEAASLSRTERLRLARAEEILRGSVGSLPSVDVLARAAGVSENTLQRLFHTAYGTTVFNYVRTMRLDKARRILEEDGISIDEAAYLAGYTSAANFSTAFKRQYGMSPGCCRCRLGRSVVVRRR